jgi:hypothetical protein
MIEELTFQGMFLGTILVWACILIKILKNRITQNKEIKTQLGKE